MTPLIIEKVKNEHTKHDIFISAIVEHMVDIQWQEISKQKLQKFIVIGKAELNERQKG